MIAPDQDARQSCSMVCLQLTIPDQPRTFQHPCLKAANKDERLAGLTLDQFDIKELMNRGFLSPVDEVQKQFHGPCAQFLKRLLNRG